MFTKIHFKNLGIFERVFDILVCLGGLYVTRDCLRAVSFEHNDDEEIRIEVFTDQCY